MKTITQLEQLIGQTPMVKLDYFSRKSFNVFAKLEGQNIGGSIKDRVAWALINDLENKGFKKDLERGRKTILEPSSGNTGIGLAMIGAARGYAVKIVLPETATAERVAMMKIFGAQVEFCSAQDWKGDTAIQKVKKIAQEEEKYLMPNQYENPVCVEIHEKTTGREILEQCPAITHLVAAMGTGGTITGVARRLKKYDSAIQVLGAEVHAGSQIPGPRSLEGYVPPILDFGFIDERIMIENEVEVFELQEILAKKQGLFVGPSSAAALSVALKVGEEKDKNKKSGENKQKEKNVVVIFPDRGEKYLSKLK